MNLDPPNVPLLRALCSQLDGTWGVLKGSWGVLSGPCSETKGSLKLLGQCSDQHGGFSALSSYTGPKAQIDVRISHSGAKTLEGGYQK